MEESVSSSCPCHSGKPYAECCYPFHAGKACTTPQELMRARYAAYAMGKTSYIIETTHPSSPAFAEDIQHWASEIDRFSHETCFEGLEILDHSGEEKEATVTFRATLQQYQRDASFVEKSRFSKLNQQWLYLDGIIID